MERNTERRSSRISKLNVEQHAAEPIKINENSLMRKRKNSVPFRNKRPKVLKRVLDGKITDAYCWICHKPGHESECDSCPRVYHKSCVEKVRTQSQSQLCECHMMTVDGKNEDLSLSTEELKTLLQYVMKEALKEDKKNNHKHKQSDKFRRLFQTWPAENETSCKIMDLDILNNNVNGEEPYLSTGHFFIDVKWIFHNCCIAFGLNSEITKRALELEKKFKQELIDVEACSECYAIQHGTNYSEANFFDKVCSKPHTIVWAKLRGFPFWPAKCLKIRNGSAYVKFFGTHDKSILSLDRCFKISRENPMKKVPERYNYRWALDELAHYIMKFETTVGPFKYYKQKTPLDEDVGSKKKYRKVQNAMKNTKQVSQNKKLIDTGKEVESPFRISGNFVQHEIDQAYRTFQITEPSRKVDSSCNILHDMNVTDEETQSTSQMNSSSLCVSSGVHPYTDLSSSPIVETSYICPNTCVSPTENTANKNSDLLKNVPALNTLFEIFIANRPELKSRYREFQNFTTYTFMKSYFKMACSKNDDDDIKAFFEICETLLKEREELKKRNLEAEKEIKELTKKIENMKELRSQKLAIKDSIILAASQNIRKMDEKKWREIVQTGRLMELENTIEEYKTSENQLITENSCLKKELKELKEKLSECSAVIIKWEESSKNVDENNTQTEKSYLYKEYLKKLRLSKECEQVVQKEVAHHDYLGINQQANQTNQANDSSQSTRSIQCNSFTVQHNTLSSVPFCSSVNAGIVQQFHGQTLHVSQSTEVITTPAAGFVNVAADVHSLLPVGMPPNPVISTTGPIIVSVAGANTFMNPF